MKNNEITIYELMGLIKDNKAPKKIKIDNDIWYLVKRDSRNCYIDKEEYCFHCCQIDFDYYIEENKLDTIVEILPEENDEWEDIEEIQRSGDCIINEVDGETQLMNINARDRLVYIPIINKLIKNQRKIIEKLESKGEN